MVNDMFKKLVEKKKAEGKGFSPVEKEASDNVLSDLMHFLSGMEGEKVKGLKKVTVASPDQAGLQAGLDKAKDLVSQSDDSSDDSDDESQDDESSDEGQEDDGSGGEDHEDPVAQELADHEQHDAESEDEIKQQIAELQAKLASRG